MTKAEAERLAEINPERWELIREQNRVGLSIRDATRLAELQKEAGDLADILAPLDTSKTDALGELLRKHGAE